jgi:hypothetical protein
MKVRLSNYNEIHIIQKFINLHWKKNHILSKDINLLKWQHKHKDKKKISIAVLENQQKTIVGVLGFISINNYTANINNKNDYIWLGIWCMDNNVNQIYGLKLMYYFLNNKNIKYIGGIGLTKNIIPLYKKLNFEVGEMKHFYILNHKKKKYTLSKNLKKNKYLIEKKLKLKESKYLNAGIFTNNKEYSFKNYKYFKYRYENHPVYKYRFLHIILDKKIILLIVIRKILIKKTSVLRIIDTYGNWSEVKNLASLLQNFIIKEKCEFIDFLYEGFNKKNIIRNGFNIKSKNQIIPNHFEPYEGIVNQPLYYCYKSDKNYELHKGDADSDRPNLPFN